MAFVFLYKTHENAEIISFLLSKNPYNILYLICYNVGRTKIQKGRMIHEY